MAKRVIWTETAYKVRRGILEYWLKHNKSKTYSKNYQKNSKKGQNTLHNLITWENRQILKM